MAVQVKDMRALAGLIIKIKNDGEGKIFHVRFVKKDGSVREMKARFGVKKDVNGNGMSFDPLAKQIIPVWDMVKSGWRMINLYAIMNIKFKGVEYEIANKRNN